MWFYNSRVWYFLLKWNYSYCYAVSSRRLSDWLYMLWLLEYQFYCLADVVTIIFSIAIRWWQTRLRKKINSVMQQNYWKWPYFSAVDKLIMYGNGYSLNLKPMLCIFMSLFSRIMTSKSYVFLLPSSSASFEMPLSPMLFIKSHYSRK